jgi:2-polyprenyl-6-methoxyphenol hydroxylase-like FAD-dependent oxidoreductase
MTDRTVHRHDVVVVGARAAGAATALLLARLGHDVVVVDRAVFPADTVSTHQIARPGVVQLHRWGLLDAVVDSGAPALRQVTLSADGASITRKIKDKSGVDLLVAPRRHVLDTLVAEAAEAAGATLRSGVTVGAVLRDVTGRVCGVRGHDIDGADVEIAARFVVGADGLTSRVARAVRAPVIENRGETGATQYAYYGGIPWTGIEFLAAPGSLVGVFPTHAGEACIFVSSSTADARAARRAAASREDAFTAQLTTAAPELAARLAAAERTSPVTGMLRSPNLVRKAWGPGWALVGDAGYHRDPITGQGLSDAYRDAETLAVALDRVLRHVAAEPAALGEYAHRREESLRPIFELTLAMAQFPPVPEFVELQKRLAEALDTEAAELAARPVPGERQLACA